MSWAVPFLFPPILYKEYYYVDGAIINKIPMSDINENDYEKTIVIWIDCYIPSNKWYSFYEYNVIWYWYYILNSYNNP